MRTYNVLPLCFLLVLLPCLHSARLRLIQANVPGGLRAWRKGPFLRPPTTTVCPTRRFPEFTVQCLTSRSATSATFFVNGTRFRTERVMPFILTGDVRGIATPWTPPGETVVIRCEANDGNSVEVTVVLSCDRRKRKVKVKATDAGEDMGGMGMGGDGMGMGGDGMSMGGDGMGMDGDGMDMGGDAPDEPVGEPGRSSPRDDSGSGGDGCVKIGALEFESLEGAWETVGDALVYKRGDDSLGVDRPGEAPVEYSFVAPVTSRYGVTLDMETDGGVDHNDVFLEFESGGFTLNRANGSTRRATGWVKAYHNRNGRALEAFSVDFNPHVFTTTQVLMEGVRYTIRVGGRSTKVTIHAVVLFACEGDVCQGTRAFFQAANMCNE
eukprot:GFKZ01007656.1.p1 GENE.GFKZ01007656.1~~GFKZ01007656.1.p1  ORF type:complete len:381 (-),score=44.60 GFKZ01007656.1:97-1239(-)